MGQPDLADAVDPIAAAELAGLRYVSDTGPGIARKKHGSRFTYESDGGKKLTDAATLARIRALAIPPAWTDVWICPSANGHIQATGRDARGRKQYRYHARWRKVRDATKFHRMIAFGRALPSLRARVAADLAKPGLPREKVLATVVRLLEATTIRVGNEEYERDNRSYGLTTLKPRHVRVGRSRIQFRFRGKSGKVHEIELLEPRLAKLVKRIRDLPGQDLFQYLDEAGEPHNIGSADVNAYLREISGDDFTSKDFRTWAATRLAAATLARAKGEPTVTRAKRAVVQAVAEVAERLGNTAAVCRKCYIHPAVIDAYLDGDLRGAASEKAVLHLLERRAQGASS